MITASSSATELVDYGRNIGLFAALPTSEAQFELISDNPMIADITELLQRETSPAGPSGWSKTPFVGASPVIKVTRLGHIISTAASTPVLSGRIELPSFSLPTYEVQTLRAKPFASDFVVARTRQLRSVVEEAGAPFDFEAAAAEILAITDLSVAEFTGLFGRTRERYYAWRRGRVPREIIAKARSIKAALGSVRLQPPHQVRAWLKADDDAALKLLVAEDYAKFEAVAEAWLTSHRPREARLLTGAEIAALAEADGPDDAIERFRALAMAAEMVSVPRVSPSPNFYRDLFGSDSDDDE